jgi:hypothetical protein
MLHDVSPLGAAALLALAAYLPSYLRPLPRQGRSYSKRVAGWSGWRVVWTRVLGMPEAAVVVTDPAARGGADAQRIYGSHPHGVGSMHHIGVMMCPPVCAPGRSFEEVCPAAHRLELTASVMFRLPLVRELALALGCCDAGRDVVDAMLARGKSIGVMTGGEQEQLLSRRGEHTVYVTRRKGLVRLALRHGVALVPCYCFGETDTYHQSTLALRARQALCKRLGIAITPAYGRSRLLPFLPIPTKLVQVVGSPIAVEKVEAPTEADVERVHAQYVAGLRDVFDRYKAELGYPDARLVVV